MKWEVAEMGPGGIAIVKDAQHGELGAVGSPLCCHRVPKDDAYLIVAAVNTLLAAAHKANADPIEYALAAQAGDVDLASRVTVEVEGGSLLEGIKGGGMLKGRTFHFQTNDLETVKRLVDWEKASPGHKDVFLELMGDDDD